MDSIINFIINCILSIIDLYLINFYILNYNHKADENTNYLKINMNNLICLFILIFLNATSPGFIVSILITINILILKLILSQYTLLEFLKIITLFIGLKFIIYIFSHLVFSTIFDTPIISYYSDYLLSYILLVMSIERYLMYSIFLIHFNYLTTKILHHFKILSIILFISVLYLSSTIMNFSTFL